MVMQVFQEALFLNKCVISKNLKYHIHEYDEHNLYKHNIQGNTVSASAFVLYPVILPVESITGVKPPKRIYSK